MDNQNLRRTIKSIIKTRNLQRKRSSGRVKPREQSSSSEVVYKNGHATAMKGCHVGKFERKIIKRRSKAKEAKKSEKPAPSNPIVEEEEPGPSSPIVEKEEPGPSNPIVEKEMTTDVPLNLTMERCIQRNENVQIMKTVQIHGDTAFLKVAAPTAFYLDDNHGLVPFVVDSDQYKGMQQSALALLQLRRDPRYRFLRSTGQIGQERNNGNEQPNRSDQHNGDEPLAVQGAEESGVHVMPDYFVANANENIMEVEI